MLLYIGSSRLLATAHAATSARARELLRRRTQPMIASSTTSIPSAVLTIGPTAEGTTSGSTYTDCQTVRPLLLPCSREDPAHTENAIGMNSPGENGAPEAGRRGRLKMTDHSPWS